MSDTIRVKDLATELAISNKEVLQGLRDLGVPAKSHMSSIDEESAQALRKVLQKQDEPSTVIERKVQPGVIVRRRRKAKDAPTPEEAEDKSAQNKANKEPSKASSAQKIDTDNEVDSAHQEQAKTSTSTKTSKKKKKKKPEPAKAKIISRPNDEPAVQPEPKELAPEKLEKPKKQSVEEKPDKSIAPEKKAQAEAPVATKEQSTAAKPQEGSSKKKKKKSKKKIVQEPQIRVISKPDPAQIAAAKAISSTYSL